MAHDDVTRLGVELPRVEELLALLDEGLMRVRVQALRLAGKELECSDVGVRNGAAQWERRDALQAVVVFTCATTSTESGAMNVPPERGLTSPQWTSISSPCSGESR